MLQSLRTRLLWSYIAVLLILLALIGTTLVVFLRSRPLPTDPIISRLAGDMLDLRTYELWRAQLRRGDDLEAGAIALMDTIASERDLHLLLLTQAGTVVYDTAGALTPGEMVRFSAQNALLSTGRMPATRVIRGQFVDADGQEWIFVAQVLELMMMDPIGADSLYLAVIEPVPLPTLRQVIRTFGQTFLVPLARSGAISLLLAIGLSALIARSISRSLNDLNTAARRMAQGDLDQRVPLKGPREVRTVAASFNEMAARVSATQQAQRDFLANVSHDLRTPLTSIQGFSQAIVEGVAADPESAQRAAQIIHDEAARLHRMVEGLLDLARLEADRSPLLRDAVAVGAIVQGVVEKLALRAREQDISLTCDCPPHLPVIRGDGDRLAQSFTNLLDNAIRHTPPGGTIAVRAEAQPDAIIVTIRDSGEGIPPADLPRIFERFYQVDKSRQRRHSGAGLGLSIVRQVVEAHGGTIDVASVVGEGTVFTIRLPLDTSPDPA